MHSFIYSAFNSGGPGSRSEAPEVPEFPRECESGGTGSQGQGRIE